MIFERKEFSFLRKNIFAPYINIFIFIHIIRTWIFLTGVVQRRALIVSNSFVVSKSGSWSLIGNAQRVECGQSFGTRAYCSVRAARPRHPYPHSFSAYRQETRIFVAFCFFVFQLIFIERGFCSFPAFFSGVSVVLDNSFFVRTWVSSSARKTSE